MKVALHCLSLKPEFSQLVLQLIERLDSEKIKIELTESCNNQLRQIGVLTHEIWPVEKAANLSDPDFIFSIGGDGTILDTVCLVGKRQIPIVGLNTGRMGFLATVTTDKITEAISQLIHGNFQIESRTLLSLTSNKKLFHGLNFALNEFTIHKRDTSSMITVHTYIDGNYLNSYWADGLIVATPTGSTGYSLSCGGPLITPEAKNFIITPVSPHNLNVRPIIVPDESEISFEIEGRTDKFMISLDSRSTAIRSDLKLSVKKEKFTAKLVKFHGDHFFDTLRKKLNWGFDMRN